MDNPNIDGSKVPTIGDPDSGTAPTCDEACTRLAALCGYAPPACTTDAGDGYCETNLDDGILLCVGQAPSCQAAWDCINAVPATDDAGDESTTDDAATDDAATDAPTE